MISDKLIFEMKRKLFHICGGFGLIFLIHHFSSNTATVILFTVGALVFILDYTKILHSIFAPIGNIAYSITREHEAEKGKISGATWMIIGLFLCMALKTNHDITIIALLMLTLSDTVAAICGMTIGSIEICKGKTLEGMIGFFLTSVLIITIYTILIPSIYFQADYLYIVAAVATAIEVISAKIGLDDNFAIPLFTVSSYNLLCILF